MQTLLDDGLGMWLSHGVLGLWEARSCPCESFKVRLRSSRRSIFIEAAEEVAIPVRGI